MFGVRGLGSGVKGLVCSGSEPGSYVRLIDFVYHSTLGLSVMKKMKNCGCGCEVWGALGEGWMCGVRGLGVGVYSVDATSGWSAPTACRRGERQGPAHYRGASPMRPPPPRITIGP